MARSSQAPIGMPITGTVLSGVAIFLQAGWWIIMIISAQQAQATAAQFAGPRPTEPVAAAEWDLNQLEEGMADFYADHGRFPKQAEGIQALLTNPGSDRSWMGPYGQTINKIDPWGRPYKYRYPGKTDPEDCDIYSLGPDGVDGTSDDVTLSDE